MVKHLNIRIFGQVQGVFFRHSTKEKAEELNIKGSIQNESSGSVYIEAEGDEEALEKFIKWCNQSPGLAKVEKIEVKKGEIRNFTDFSVGH